jgi:DNA-binding response OmpR family regulator
MNTPPNQDGFGGKPTEALKARAPEAVEVWVCEESMLMREFLLAGLADRGIQGTGLPNGRSLDLALSRRVPDILLLGVNLPDENGYSVTARLRERYPFLGIILLTVRDQLEDRLRALESGADLFLVKPVEIRELGCAVQSLFRRLSILGGHRETRGWRFDSRRSLLTTPSGSGILLTGAEWQFLTILLEQPGKVVTRDQILLSLGQKPDIYAVRRLETMISRLRSKVRQQSPQDPLPVRARHGQGYVFLGQID